MKTKRVSNSHQRLAQENLRLRETAFQSYLKVLSKLVQACPNRDFLQGFASALRRRDFRELLVQAGSLSSQKYDDATDHFVANQLSLLVRKYPWDCSLIGTDPLSAAHQSFLKAERRNGRVNRRHDLLDIDPSRDKFREEGKRMMKWIRSVIGLEPNYRAIFRKCDFGQGASVGVHGDDTHVLRKLSSDRWTVTPGAIHHGFAALVNNHHYLAELLPRREDGMLCYDLVKAFDAYIARIDVIEYNKISFVNKTAETHRVIALESIIGGLVQKGIDNEMRHMLHRVGLDLTDQTLNQRLACEGSVDDSEDGFVTIDLKDASNSVCLSPIRRYFPRGWYDLLVRTRSTHFQLDGAVKRYNMLSSMGNGFSFPVETLLFAAACRACGCGVPGQDFAVYGDDIVIRKRYATSVVGLLKHLGFKLNVGKTFLDGPFRESCGTDWFNGQDVRPFTLDFALDSVQNIFKFMNLSQRNERTKSFFQPVRGDVMSLLSVGYRFIRPFNGPVDTAINTTGDEHLTSPHCVYKDGVWSWKVLVHEPISDIGAMASARNEHLLMGVALRGAVSNPQGIPTVTFRRKTKTKVARESYASTSNWLPPR